MNKILDHLYLGDLNDAQNIFKLKKAGITHILQVAAAFKPVYPQDFIYLVIPLLDMPFVNISRHFQEAIVFINNALQHGGTVLVHCFAGVSRSASIVIAYLMHEMGMPMLEAMSFTRRRRPIIFPNFGFQRQLLDFEKALRAYDPNHFKGKLQPKIIVPSQGVSRDTAVKTTLHNSNNKIPFGSKQDKVQYLKQMQSLMNSLQMKSSSSLQQQKSQQEAKLKANTSYDATVNKSRPLTAVNLKKPFQDKSRPVSSAISQISRKQQIETELQRMSVVSQSQYITPVADEEDDRKSIDLQSVKSLSNPYQTQTEGKRHSLLKNNQKNNLTVGQLIDQINAASNKKDLTNQSFQHHSTKPISIFHKGLEKSVEPAIKPSQIYQNAPILNSSPYTPINMIAIDKLGKRSISTGNQGRKKILIGSYQLSAEEQTQLYNCQQCNTGLFEGKDIIQHNQGSGCQCLFIKQQNWISEGSHYSATPARGQRPGVIECPRKACKSKIGFYSYNGLRCNQCGKFVAPGFQILKCRIKRAGDLSSSFIVTKQSSNLMMNNLMHGGSNMSFEIHPQSVGI